MEQWKSGTVYRWKTWNYCIQQAAHLQGKYLCALYPHLPPTPFTISGSPPLVIISISPSKCWKAIASGVDQRPLGPETKMGKVLLLLIILTLACGRPIATQYHHEVSIEQIVLFEFIFLIFYFFFFLFFNFQRGKKLVCHKRWKQSSI